MPDAKTPAGANAATHAAYDWEDEMGNKKPGIAWR